MKEFNLVLVGVGGQGILLATEILGVAAVKERLNVRISEIHGMAQRGGAVVSNLRIGEKVFAPTVLERTADIVLGFEPLETLRNLKFVSENTLVLINNEPIPPPVLINNGKKYPSQEEITERISYLTKNVIVIEAAKLAKKAGSSLTVNIVLIGGLAATQKMPFKNETLKEAISELISAKYLQINMKAFELGYKYVQEKTRASMFRGARHNK